MCQSMVNIQFPTAEIRRGKKKKKEEERRRRKKQDENIMVAPLHRATITNKKAEIHSRPISFTKTLE